MRISLQDDNGVELDCLPDVGEGSFGLETVNAATGTVRLTHDTTLALAMMLYHAGVRPAQAPAPKLKDNVLAFLKPGPGSGGPLPPEN